MSIDSIKIVYDSNKKEILKFPVNTILDNVAVDLWSEIIKYMCRHQYALGISDCIYSGYRAMSKDEFGHHKHKFLDYYWTNRGIYVLDKLKQLGGSNYLTVDNYLVKYDYHTIKFRSVNKNEKTTLGDNLTMQNSELLYLNNTKSKRTHFYNYDIVLILLVPDI